MTIKQMAAKHNVSPQAIYKRLKKQGVNVNVLMDKETQELTPEGEMIRAASLFVEGYSGSLTVHMRAPSGGTVFLVSSDGTFIPAYSERDGSYIVFTMDNGRSFVYMTEPERHAPVTALMITGGIFVVDAILLIVILSGRKRRKKTTRKKKP